MIKFGDIVVNPYASENNPIKRSMFVREIRKTGKLNPGIWWEMTDGKGKFWRVEKKDCKPEQPK